MSSIWNYVTLTEQFATPVIGMGATLLGWSDRYAYTVIAMSKSGKTITLQEDDATRTDTNGMSESQQYDYVRNLRGRIIKAFRTKSHGWRHKRMKVLLGVRDSYYDYSF
jgi:hypothetical protein